MDIHDELLRRLDAATGDRELSRLSPGLSMTVGLVVGGRAIALRLDGGMLSIPAHPAEADVTLRADAEDWTRVLADPPPPTFHSFTAFQLANDRMELDGDPLAIARARPALERIVELLVRARVAEAAPVGRDLRAIKGAYRTLSVGGAEFDVFFEEAGTGPPVLFLHTAGADGRQFQAQLSDLELGASHRLVAVDLPLHGRSMPPLEWEGEPYKLTAATYRDWCVAIIEQIVGERAIVAGGSMGAAMAMVLGAERPSHLAGIVAIEPPFRSKGRKNPYQHHVEVHGALHNAAYVRGLMGPMSPQANRRRASWIYSQGAPGIYPGDLSFYSEEFDGADVAPRIDAAKVPTVLLSGAYDYSATPADADRLASLIPGALHITMDGLGHFPMCEHPDYFRPFLVEALRFIEERAD